MKRKLRTDETAPVALVTGAGRRLGRAIARALAEHGFDVVLNYHTSHQGAESAARAIQGLGRRALVVKADITKRVDVNDLVRKSMAEFGRLDLLVNNAAVFQRASLRTMTERAWERALAVNLTGTMRCCQAVAPHMLRQEGGGRIINIASLGGLQAWKEHLPYSVSKAGVIHLTRILARELAPTIQVNAVAPGTIIVPGEESTDVAHVPVAKIPLARYGKPSDITDLVVFLATKAEYITGQVIAVDGGRSVSLS